MILSHLLELRARLIHCLLFFLLVFAVFFIWAPEFFNLLMTPLLHVLPHEHPMIATNITTPLLTPITLAAQAAFLCSVPYFLYHLWRFVTPGLFQHERRFFARFFILSFLLFILGGLFCFYGLLPWIFYMMVHVLPQGVQLMPDMANASYFVTHWIILIGLFFQIPLVCLVLVRFNHVSLDTLRVIRPYIIVLAFVLGMLLTPPDVISQILLALPLWGLFELGVFLARFCLDKTVEPH